MYISQLTEAGLFVSKPFPSGHAWEHGAHVGKPTSTEGNFISGYNFGIGNVKMNAPAVVLYPLGDSWMVRMQRSIPVAGPGDFENRWETLKDAVDDILDFYFGDDERMKLAAR